MFSLGWLWRESGVTKRFCWRSLRRMDRLFSPSIPERSDKFDETDTSDLPACALSGKPSWKSRHCLKLMLPPDVTNQAVSSFTVWIPLVFASVALSLVLNYSFPLCVDNFYWGHHQRQIPLAWTFFYSSFVIVLESFLTILHATITHLQQASQNVHMV